jgi:hypothetical protein
MYIFYSHDSSSVKTDLFVGTANRLWPQKNQSTSAPQRKIPKMGPDQLRFSASTGRNAGNGNQMIMKAQKHIA